MTYNRSESAIRFLGVVALVVLCLAGCSESPPPRAPAPPPRPPPFQPQAVEVKLGEHGGEVTLMTTQAGGYTRDGSPFNSGDTVEGSNGSTYKLTLAEGRWSAEYVAPDPVELRLGASGVTLSLNLLEDGTYEADGKPVASGDIWTAPTGSQYRLSLQDGEWRYEYVAPAPISVQLGASGEVAQITRREDGNFEINGQQFTVGGIYEAENGNRYRISFANGQWTARFEPSSAVRVALGASGLTISITRQEDGSYRAGNLVIQHGGIITASNGSQYRMTLSGGTWSATFVAPDATPVILGTSGDVIYLTLREDGLFESGGRTISSGGIWQASNGNQYRLTRLASGQWEAEFLAPPPATVLLGASGRSVVVTTLEDGRFEADGAIFSNGGTIVSSGNTYRMTLTQNGWSAIYVPPDAVAVALGTSGDALVIRRQEDGRYRAGDTTIVSGGIVEASNGNRYRLTLFRTATGSRWQVDFIPPEPVRVRLGASRETRLIAQREDGSYSVGNQTVRSGDTVLADSGNEYRLTLADGVWTAEYVRPAPTIVPLGASGLTVAISRLENGSFEVDGGQIVSGYEYLAPNGNTYRLTLSGGQWSADFMPTQVVVTLGNSGQTITLVREEDGQYWLGRKVFQTGSTHTLPDGKVYRLTLANGEWSAEFVPNVVQVPAGDSGTTLILQRLEDGKYVYEGREVRVGDTLTVNGNEYVLTQRDGQLVADFRAGSVTIPLGTSGNSVTLVKQEDGTYTRNGRVFRSGQSVIVAGVTYRLTLGTGGWIATERPPPTGGTGDPGGGGSGPTREDERTISFESSNFGLKDAGDTSTGDEGTILVVGSSGQTQAEYSVYDLVGRGLVSQKQTFVEAARKKLQTIVDKITEYHTKEIYERGIIDPNVDIGDTSSGAWQQAKDALNGIASGFDARLSSTPWRGNTIEADEVEDVIDELNEVIQELSSASGLEDGFTIPQNHTAQDIFDAPMSKIRFGSTSNTRFGAYANNSGDATSGTWSSGVFAYSPLSKPDTGDLPTRGQATYRGRTVAVDPGAAARTLYTGDIELLARFSTGRISGLVENLVDEDGDAWIHNSTRVDYVLLPPATMSGDHDGGFSVTGANATVRYPPGFGSTETLVGSSEFKGQFVSDEREVFGTWKVGAVLEGAYGTTRSGTTPVTGPRPNDSGTNSLTKANDTVPDTDGDITFISANPLVKFRASTLYSSKRRSQVGDRYVTEARNEIIEQIRQLGIASQITDTTARNSARTALWNKALAALGTIFGTSGVTYDNIPATIPSGDTEAREKLTDMRDALSSQSSFSAALGNDDNDIFKGTTGVATTDVDDIFAAVAYRFGVQYDYTNYTRFGAWSNTSLGYANDTPAITQGVFAYSPLAQTDLDTTEKLNFRAVYEGKTVAVDHGDGSLYTGVFQIAVQWDSSGSTSNLSAFARDLRKVSDNSWFQYGGVDVGYVLFTGSLTVNNTGSLEFSHSPTVDVRYRATNRQQENISGSHTLTGKFVGKGIDGPWGVIGTWNIAGGGSSDAALQGGYGADLLP